MAAPGMDVPFRDAFSLERKKVYMEIYEDFKPPQGLSQRALGKRNENYKTGNQEITQILKPIALARIWRRIPGKL